MGQLIDPDNQGQIPHADVRFYASTTVGTLFITREGDLVYDLPLMVRDRKPARWTFRESFLDARPARVEDKSRGAAWVSYFKGSDSGQWRSDLETFESVVLGELYPDIRVELEAGGGGVEKLFYVGPGGDVNRIAIAIDGVEKIVVGDAQQLLLETSHGEAAFTAPVAYQLIDGERRPVEVAYALEGDHRYGFRVGQYDRRHELVIDPMLAATYLDGSAEDRPTVVAVDTIGLVWAAGFTDSGDLPTTEGAFDRTDNGGTSDAFLSLFDTEVEAAADVIFVDDFELGDMSGCSTSVP